MLRETRLNKTVALLATGDEISVGDILNTNAQEIALRLTKQDIQVRTHMVVPDNINEIEKAIHYLLADHDALIITGGLGPTSDDLTRYAVANTLEQPLIFNEDIWNDICQRLKKFGYDVPPESNRQQALFPESATIIPNPNGTAAGSYLKKDKKTVFMLPGPPMECLPMLESVVDKLIKEGFQQPTFHQNWFLFGVSEGQIAEELDALAVNYNCVTGYRLFYPYIEFKLQSQDQADFDTLIAEIKTVIQPYIIGDGSKIASDILREKIFSQQLNISIDDQATGGALQSKLTIPKTLPFLKFSDSKTAALHLKISGLNEFWQQIKDVTHTNLKIIFYQNGKEIIKETTIPFRGWRVIQFAVEYICRETLKMQQADGNFKKD